MNYFILFVYCIKLFISSKTKDILRFNYLIQQTSMVVVEFCTC